MHQSYLLTIYVVDDAMRGLARDMFPKMHHPIKINSFNLFDMTKMQLPEASCLLCLEGSTYFPLSIFLYQKGELGLTCHTVFASTYYSAALLLIDGQQTRSCLVSAGVVPRPHEQFLVWADG